MFRNLVLAMTNPGDRVKLVTSQEEIEGLLLPSFEKEIILIKLDSGYNMGFSKKDVKKMVLLEKAKEKTNTIKPISQRKDLPTISILHTGGTIASKVDYRTGGVVSSFEPSQLLELFPELKSIANIESELVAQMWSDDLRFSHLTLLAKKIEEHAKKKVAGIIVGMGTDNLAVAAAALSFMIESSPVPIIFVGSQRSSDRGSTDAAMNLLCAARFIIQSDFSGVAVCMHEKVEDKSCAILPAAKTMKLHSSRRDAFKPVNSLPIARVHYFENKIEFLAKEYPKKGGALVVKPKMEDKVGLLKVHINMFPSQILFFKKYKGLIIEGTGLGQMPGQVPNLLAAIHKKFYPAIKSIIKSGCVVVMTTQCIFGSVNMNVYDKGRDLLGLGIIQGKDMLANTAFVKLSWLLANYPKKEVAELVQKNLRGEINERLSFSEDFI